MSFPEEIAKKVQTFDAIDIKSLTEEDARVIYINPLFGALGWAVDSLAGEREVVHEDKIKSVHGHRKAPDYGFYLAGERRFFVEAKKPSKNLSKDSKAAFQLRSYAWCSGLPISVLTDFEEFVIYDCTIEPKVSDSAQVARLAYYRFDDYAEHWGDISKILSRQAVLDGSLDVLAASPKRGAQPIDRAFLADIEHWREALATDLLRHNPDLSDHELTYAVQKIIDRTVFLRICEDRGVEDYGRLASVAEQAEAYEGLLDLWHQADDKYNSGLFHFGAEAGRFGDPDEFTPTLKVGTPVIRDIVSDLYYPKPYVFDAIPPDILGKIYEQFLGKVIRRGKTGIKVVPKPEVRKAGGVYYTPRYIVRYIIRETVGPLLAGKSPGQLSRIRVLDPACGSGTFLVAAFEYLLEQYLAWYVARRPDKRTKGKGAVLFRDARGQWRLTIAEKKRILLANIFGVDVDPQAVEVTKLALLLKVLEGETEQLKQTHMFQERALPNLSENIRCGDSLIGPSFFGSSEDSGTTNPFDWWNSESGFGAIMDEGGFDAVIGNPPYLRIQGLQKHHRGLLKYFESSFVSAVKRFDFYLLFIERGYQLLRAQGRLGYICPHKFLNADLGSGLRGFLAEKTALESLLSFGHNRVFEDASTYTGICILEKSEKPGFEYDELPPTPAPLLPAALRRSRSNDRAFYEYSGICEKPWKLATKGDRDLLESLLAIPHNLGVAMSHILVGIQAGIDPIHILKDVGANDPDATTVRAFSERANSEIEIERALLKPLLNGRDVSRYEIPIPEYWCIYPYSLEAAKTKIIGEAELSSRFPLGYRYLHSFKDELRDIRVRQKTNPKYWYSCHRSRDMRVFESRRIVSPEISLGCNMTIADPGLYHNTQVYSFVPSPSGSESLEYWLAILNSPLLWWFLTQTGTVLRGGYFRFKTNYLRPFPVPNLDLSKARDSRMHDDLAEAVSSILECSEQLNVVKTPHEKSRLKRRRDALERNVDQLVFELYGLSDEHAELVGAAYPK